MFTFLFKPTNSCNLRCRYCFITSDHKDWSVHMNLDGAYVVFEKIYRFIRSFGDNKCRILWHGGEPLIWGIDNFRAIFKYLIETYPDFVFEHCMQSNITLLNRDYLELFKTYNCALSTSLDGYEILNDHNRIFKNGKGTFKKVKEKLLLAKSIRVHIGVIVVVSPINIDHLIEIYEFFKSLGIGFRLNPLSLIGDAKANTCDGVSPERFAKSLIKLFDYWINDEDAVGITNFVEIASNLKTGLTYSCAYSPNCQGTLTTIEPNGDITPCDRFSGLNQFVYGNIYTDELRPIMDRKFKDYQERTDNLKNTECKNCSLWDICRGGCPSDSFYSTHSIYHKSAECQSLRLLAAHIKERLSI